MTGKPPPPSPVPDGPEADIQEQHQTVDPDGGGGLDLHALTRDPEVPEADAIEQAQTVPLPDDEHDGGDDAGSDIHLDLDADG